MDQLNSKVKRLDTEKKTAEDRLVRPPSPGLPLSDQSKILLEEQHKDQVASLNKENENLKQTLTTLKTEVEQLRLTPAPIQGGPSKAESAHHSSEPDMLMT